MLQVVTINRVEEQNQTSFLPTANKPHRRKTNQSPWPHRSYPEKCFISRSAHWPFLEEAKTTSKNEEGFFLILPFPSTFSLCFKTHIKIRDRSKANVMIRYGKEVVLSQNSKRVPLQTTKRNSSETRDLLLKHVAKLGKHLLLAEHIRFITVQRVDKHHCSWQGREVRRRGAVSSSPSCMPGK